MQGHAGEKFYLLHLFTALSSKSKIVTEERDRETERETERLQRGIN